MRLGVYYFFAMMAVLSHSMSAFGDGLSFSSTTHLGFGIEDSPSTQGAQVPGSLIFVDLTSPLSEAVDIGLRTLGSGGRTAEGHFYRLTTGPVLQVEAFEHIFVHGGVGYFQESGRDGAWDYYKSGMNAMVGWARRWDLTTRVHLGMGAFCSWHQSRSLHSRDATPVASNHLNDVRRIGSLQGFESSLRVDL